MNREQKKSTALRTMATGALAAIGFGVAGVVPLAQLGMVVLAFGFGILVGAQEGQ